MLAVAEQIGYNIHGGVTPSEGERFMRTFYQKNRTVIHKALFLAGFILLVYLFIKYLFAYVAPFALGFLVSLPLNKAAGFFERKAKIPRGLSALFLIVVCILLIAVLGTSVAARVGREAESFSNNLPQYAEDARRMLAEAQAGLDSLLDLVPAELQEPYDKVISDLFSSATSLIGSGVRAGSVGLVVRLPNIFMTIILTILSTFFFIKDKKLIAASVGSKMPKWLTMNLDIIRKGLFGALGGYVKAQAIIMSVTASIAVIGLAILRSPYALVMGLLISFIDAVPVFGSGFILWPWIAISLIMGDFPLAIGLAVIYGCIFVSRQFLEPKVLGQQIGLHPLLTLMSMYAGVRVFGVLGFLVGPVIVLVVKAIMKSDISEEIVVPTLQPPAEEPAEPPAEV